MMDDAGPVELDPTARISALSAVERTLKPYGISMLPQSAKQAAEDARAKDTAPRDDSPEKEKVQG